MSGFTGPMSTDFHVRIFCSSYYDTSWDFTREMDETKLEFSDAIYTYIETFLSLEQKVKKKLYYALRFMKN